MQAFERWEPVTTEMVPNVLPYYWISDHGNVYSTAVNRIIKPYVGSSGYLQVYLYLSDGTGKNVSVHRLVLMAFKLIENQDQMDVDHLYGNKQDNLYLNLEWVTHSENIKRAYETGLKGVGENHPMCDKTDDQVRIICECLEKKLPLKECARLAGLEPNDTSMKFVSGVKYGVTHTHISKDYNIPKERNNRLFSDEQIHQICKLMEQGYSNDDLMKIVDSNMDKSKYINVVSSIRRRDRFKNISDNYINSNYSFCINAQRLFDGSICLG